MNSFYSAFLNIHRSGVLTALAWLVPHETAARESQSRRVLCTPYNHAPCHFMRSHIRKVYACLAATCHLRFWQDDRGLLRATAITRGWNGYRNKSQHRKLTLEKKILPPLQKGFEPATFRSRVRRSNHWAIPDPRLSCLFSFHAKLSNSQSHSSTYQCNPWLHRWTFDWRQAPRVSGCWFPCSKGTWWEARPPGYGPEKNRQQIHQYQHKALYCFADILFSA